MPGHRDRGHRARPVLLLPGLELPRPGAAFGRQNAGPRRVLLFDAANEDGWEPILAILDGVNSTLAGRLRLVIKIQKQWNDFVDGWNKTVGPFADAVGKLADDLTGGTLSAFKDYLVQAAARQAGAAAAPEVCGDDHVARKGLSGAAVQWLPVLRAGSGKPLVEPDGLVSVGPPRPEQRYGQIDVGGACVAQVRPARAGELGAELRVLGRRDVLRAQRVRAGDEAAILRRARAGAAEHADEQGGDQCGCADREAARAGREIPDRQRPACGEAVEHGGSSFSSWSAPARMTDLPAAGKQLAGWQAGPGVAACLALQALRPAAGQVVPPCSAARLAATHGARVRLAPTSSGSERPKTAIRSAGRSKLICLVSCYGLGDHDPQWCVEEGGGIDVEAALGADDVGGQVGDAVSGLPFSFISVV